MSSLVFMIVFNYERQREIADTYTLTLDPNQAEVGT